MDVTRAERPNGVVDNATEIAGRTEQRDRKTRKKY
jgi:hypothetical protein